MATLSITDLDSGQQLAHTGNLLYIVLFGELLVVRGLQVKRLKRHSIFGDEAWKRVLRSSATNRAALTFRHKLTTYVDPVGRCGFACSYRCQCPSACSIGAVFS